MKTVNSEHYITTEQLKSFILLLGEKYFPRNLIVFESRWQRFLYNLKNPSITTDYDLFPSPRGIFGVPDQNYIPYTDTVELFCYYPYGKSDIRLGILKSLAYALRVRHYYYDYIKEQDVNLKDGYVLEDIQICKERIYSAEYTMLIEKFVYNFINTNRHEINNILSNQKQGIKTNHIPV